MRSKEEAHDYRYFPDPDLLPLEISEALKEQVRATLPELPESKRQRYMKDFGLSSYDAGILTSSREMADFFEAAVNSLFSQIRSAINLGAAPSAEPYAAKLCANWIIGEVSAQLNRDGLDIVQCLVSAQQLGDIILRIVDGTILNSAAKEVFRTMWEEQITWSALGGNQVRTADEIIEAKGLKQVSDSGAIEKIVDEIITANADKVAEYRSGKDKLFGFFVGLAMKASKGKANPAQLNDILKKKLAG
jgi:aspartyl-tRNA(Asn)/glutamyl-tRNA(Gln) amidotransferase subunit B